MTAARPGNLAAGVMLVVTCEHGGNRIPYRYRPLFREAQSVLATHRGYDAGAALLARELAAAFGAPLFLSLTSRLLIDLNRSPGHARLYSEFSRATGKELRQELLHQFYAPYRAAVEACIGQAIECGRRVVHVSSHSFTPELDGQPRDTDIGLLYDPKRVAETELCRRWQAMLRKCAPDWIIRRNYPYSGVSDGFTTWLRRRFSGTAYAGIEIEINQKHVAAGGSDWRRVRKSVIEALRLSFLQESGAPVQPHAAGSASIPGLH